ncbi:MAG: sporulation integral membrane protein YtvI [Lachnospiraceae bacterium]
METNYKEKQGDKRPYWKVIVSLAFSLLGTVLFLIVGYKMLVYFMPFVIGWLIASIASPVVNFLEKKVKIVRKLGTVIMIVMVLSGIILLIYLICSKIIEELETFFLILPSMYEDIESGFGEIGNGMQGIFDILPDGIQNGLSTMISDMDESIGKIVASLSTPTVSAAGRLAKRIPSIFVATIVTFVSAYFFITDRDEVLGWAKRVTPNAIVIRMTMVSDNLKYAVGGYFKAQFKIMAVVFFILVLGFMVMGIHFSFLLAILIAFLDFLPFFGTGTALLPWALYKLLTGDYRMLVGLIVLYLVTQLIRQLIQPKLVGDSMGMKPFPTLIFLYAGYRIGGLFGMIFAVPTALIVINLYNAGAFDYILDDVRILAEGILKLRDKE